MTTEPQKLTIYTPNGTQLPIGIVPTLEETTSPIEPLSHQEQRMLEDYETIIEQGEQTLIEVGNALSVINRGKLYRAQYGSFQQYCSERWGFGRKRGYELMKVGDLAQELSAGGIHFEGLNERIRRAAAKLSSTQERVQAFGRARELAGKKKVTSRHVEEAVDELLGTKRPEILDVSPEPETPVATLCTAVLIPLNPSKETAEQAIERLFRELREFAASVKWEEGFETIVDELERRVDAMVKQGQAAQAA